MALVKISELSAISTIAATDVLPIVDISESLTNKITIAQIGLALDQPHLMQVDTTDQAIANVTLAQVITFNTDAISSGITRTTSSRFTVPTAGTYLISFSGICTGVINKQIEVWLRVSGTDVDNSNTIYPFKSTGISAIVSVTFLQEFTANQYFEFWTSGSDTGNKWDATAAGVTPTRPACPSIIMTCHRVGA